MKFIKILVLAIIFIIPQSAIADTQSPIFFQPYSLLYNYYDYHVIVYFLDHPEYEAVEAMIGVQKGDIPFIRATITRHDKTQIDYINYKEIVDKVQEQKLKRETHYSEIIYKMTMNGEEPSIQLDFTTIKNEKIIFTFNAVDKPSTKYGGLTDPERHSITSSLPIMYRGQSTLAHPDSKITFNGKIFEIPVKVHVPIFFKGMKGYFSEGFSMGIIRSDLKNLEIISSPEAFTIGEQWLYKNNGTTIEYKIVGKTGNQFLITSGKEQIEAEIINNKFQIKKISVQSDLKSRGFQIEFMPSLPLFVFDFMHPSDMRFKISIDSHDSLMTGIIKISGSEIIMIPKEPEWATKRIVQNTIKREENRISIQTTIEAR
ncbi:MAG: hypothetical protein WC836_08740 [Desulfobacula sp.]|jgi:hypothetical protein